jgi:hypothetical protein
MGNYWLNLSEFDDSKYFANKPAFRKWFGIGLLDSLDPQVAQECVLALESQYQATQKWWINN